jgi:hypothetical protein
MRLIELKLYTKTWLPWAIFVSDGLKRFESTVKPALVTTSIKQKLVLYDLDFNLSS